MRGPKPTVDYEGSTYTCKRWKVDVPDLTAMDSLSARIWLNQNTIAQGHSLQASVNLRGYGGLTVTQGGEV